MKDGEDLRTHLYLYYKSEQLDVYLSVVVHKQLRILLDEHRVYSSRDDIVDSLDRYAHKATAGIRRYHNSMLLE